MTPDQIELRRLAAEIATAVTRHELSTAQAMHAQQHLAEAMAVLAQRHSKGQVLEHG